MSKSHLADPDRQRDRAARIRALIGEGPDLVSVVTPDLTILHQSSAGERLLGATAAELRSAKFGELVHPEDLPGLRAACAEAADGIAARPVTLRLRRRDGSWLDGETLVRYVAAEQALVLSTRDVGVRARSERRHRLHFARQALVVALGGRALAGEDLLELTRSAASGLLSALEADHVTVLRYEARAVSLLATASAAGRGHSPVPEPTPDPRTQAGAALRSPEPV
ncbi:MAG TPA: PAS domain-containing protein, partial [Solirubrobacteraceae bacterium]|nr:PAS domain-containing protein [Solirubrobacteraceae bacterium]